MAQSEGEREIERQEFYRRQAILIDITARENAVRDMFCAMELTRLKEGRHKDADGRFLGASSLDKGIREYVSKDFEE